MCAAFRAPAARQLTRNAAHIHAEIVNRDGTVERRSVIYTEYFARGTEPSVVCEVHSRYGLSSSAIGLVATAEMPTAPQHHEAVSAPPPPSATTGTAKPEIAPETTADKPKKRGFWGRLFLGSGNSKPQAPNKRPE